MFLLFTKFYHALIIVAQSLGLQGILHWSCDICPILLVTGKMEEELNNMITNHLLVIHI